MNRLLILDDNRAQLDLMKSFLSAKYDCDLYQNSIEALQSLKLKDYDGVIADLHMPVVNGIDFIRKVRECGNVKIPIFIFSNDFSSSSKIDCLKLNIADYLHSGMDHEEICLRIENNLKKVPKNSILKFENITIDQDKLQIFFGNDLVDLTQIEYKILICLLQHNGRAPKKKLIEFVWPGRNVIEKTLNTHMTNLRSKLKNYSLTLVTLKDEQVAITKLV